MCIYCQILRMNLWALKSIIEEKQLSNTYKSFAELNKPIICVQRQIEICQCAGAKLFD